MRGITRTILAAFATIAATSLGTAPAIAASHPDDRTTSQSTTIRLQLVPDCSTLTAEGRAHIAKHRIAICGYAPKGGVRPNDTVYGTCGSSFVTLRRNNVAPQQIVTE